MKDLRRFFEKAEAGVTKMRVRRSDLQLSQKVANLASVNESSGAIRMETK